MKRFTVLLLLLCLLSGCAGTPQPDCAPAEGDKLTIYTSHKKEVWWPIVQEFEERTGIWVQVVEGGTNELLEALSQEKNAPQCDVMFGGGVESLEAAGSLFAPYESAAARHILPQYQSDTHLLHLLHNPLQQADQFSGTFPASVCPLGWSLVSAHSE